MNACVAAWQALQQGSCAIPRDVARWLRERGLIEEKAPKVYRLSEAAMLLAQAAAYQVPSEVIPIEQLCFQGV